MFSVAVDGNVNQIRMCNPVEMSDDLQAEVMAHNASFRVANLLGRAINGEPVNMHYLFYSCFKINFTTSVYIAQFR